MKVKIEKRELEKSLQIVKLCAREGIYSLLYIKSEGDNLTLCAGRDALQISITHKTEIELPGSCLVDGRLFQMLWGTLEEGVVELHSTEKTLFIRQGENQQTLPLGPVEDYYIIDQEVGEAVNISLNDLAAAIKYVFFAVQSGDMRPDLAAIHLKDGIFTATDSVLLGQISTAATGIEQTFPLEIREVINVLTNVTNCDKISLAMGSSWLSLSTDNVNIWLATLGIQYPIKATTIITDLQKTEPRGTIVIDLTDLRPSVDLAIAFESGAHSGLGLRLEILAENISLSIKTERGSFQRFIVAETTGAGRVRLDTARFRDVLKASPSNMLTVNFYEPNKPIIFFVAGLPWGCAMGTLHEPNI